MLVEEFEDRRRRQGPRLPRLTDHHGGVGDHQGVMGVLQHVDGTGTVDEGPGVAQVGGAHDIHFRGHLAGAGFGRAVANHVAVLDRALAVKNLALTQDFFE